MKDLHVVVCDDSETVRAQLKETLTMLGIQTIYEAGNGNEAVSLSKEMKPHLVFMDIIMPEKDGIAALTEIVDFDQAIKVVMASSSSQQSHLRKALHLGAYTFIKKPVSEAVIKDIIYSYLDEQSDTATKI